VIDCPNTEIRDLLPDMLHDNLGATDRLRVEQHLAGCLACAAEMELLVRVYALGAAAPLNADGIAGTISPYRRRRIASMPPLVRIAAGIALIAVGSASYSIASRTLWFNSGSVAESTFAPRVGDSSQPVLAAGTDWLATASGNEELDVAALDELAMTELLARIEALDADIPEDTRPLVRVPIVEGG
jgi:anti-sigma factor RsiW